MTLKNTYNCFSEKGQTDLPEINEILSTIQSGIEPIIFIDSCVCIHIIKVVDYGMSATNIDFSKILSLKEYLNNKPIKINPFFGLMELCLKNGSFDPSKFRDFKHRITFFELIPLKDFQKFRYDFNRDYFILKDIPLELANPYKDIEPSLMNSYCALLKMRSLAKKNLTKESAEANINLFLDWMVTDLDNVRAAEYKLALNVFGGNTIYRKMIGLDCKDSEVKKRLNGTSWDIFHSKTASSSFRLFQILGKNFSPYFLTSDGNLFNLFKNLNLRLIKDGGNNFNSSFLLNSDFAFPHLGDEFIDKQNIKMMNIFLDRRNSTYEFNKQKLDIHIRELEVENKIINE